MLDEIISVLFSKPLIAELTKPQAPYSHKQVRAIIEDVAQSSAMRLDPVSMTKLWELITMVFKWQVSLSSNLMDITSRHLCQTKEYASKNNTKLQIQRVQNIVENFKKLLNQNEQASLREEILEWLKIFNVRVSLLLRMGLQNNDGTFVVNNTDTICQEMLKNLGENIYAVTQNGKAVVRCTKEQIRADEPETKINELNLFADQIMSNPNSGNQKNVFTLSIDTKNKDKGEEIKPNENFCNVRLDSENNKLTELLEELVVDCAEDVNRKLTDDLLDMIEVQSDN